MTLIKKDLPSKGAKEVGNTLVLVVVSLVAAALIFLLLAAFF